MLLFLISVVTSMSPSLWASSIFHQIRRIDAVTQLGLEASIADEASQRSQEFQNSQSLLPELPVSDEYTEDAKRQATKQ